MDYHAGHEKTWSAVFSPAMQRDLLKMYEEITMESHRSSPKPEHEEAVNDLMHMIMLILERIELHNEYRALAFGLIPTMNITVKVDSKADTSLATNTVMVTSYNHPVVETARVTHDTERLKQLA